MVEMLIVALVIVVGAVLVFNKFVRGRLFSDRAVRAAPPPVMSGRSQTQDQQDTARRVMESEVERDRERRSATDKQP